MTPIVPELWSVVCSRSSARLAMRFLGVVLISALVHHRELVAGSLAYNSDENSPPTTKLKAKLFNNYDRFARPVKQINNSVAVNVSLDFKYITIEEYSSQMVIHSWVVTTWRDELLTWTPADNDNIPNLVVPSDELWLPDLSVYNSDMSQIMLFASTTCLLYSSGLVKCAPELHTPVFCDQNLRAWPYDVQNCSLYLGSWAHAGEQINVQLEGKGYRKYLYMESNAWQLLSVLPFRHAVQYANQTYPHLVYHFLLKRHAAMYAASIVVPAFVLAGLAVLGIVVPGVACKCCVCCAALLGNALFLQYIGYHLPADGDTSPTIVAYYRDAMVMGVVCLLLGLCVEAARASGGCSEVKQSSQQGSQAPQWLAGVAGWLRGSGGRAGQLLLGEQGAGIMDEDEEGGNGEASTPPVRVATSTAGATSPSSAGPWSLYATLLERSAVLAMSIAHLVLLAALVP